MLPFVLELVCARGVRVWLDGMAPEKSWSCDTNDNILTTDELKIGDWDIRQIEVIGPEHDDCDPEIGAHFVFDKAIVPETVIMTAVDGTYLEHKFQGRVTNVVTGPNEFTVEGAPKVVRMENGKDFEVDEISLYLRAELFPFPISR